MKHPIIENLNWRYATKRYDSSLKIGQHDIDIIREALRLTPTSYGLQPNKFIFIQDDSIREDLFNAAFHQHAIKDASHLIVIVSKTNLKESDIDSYMKNTAFTRDLNLDILDGYSKFLKETLGNKDEKEQLIWAQKQAYISLGILIEVCAQLKIDSTPMEGFDVKSFDKILGLSDQELSTTLVVPIGYRHSKDETQHWKKVRKAEDELFENR